MPGIFADVERADRIRVEAQDIEGKPLAFDADGLLAVCIQHEMDHLVGKLFVDYLSPLKRELVRKKLEKQRRHAAATSRRQRPRFSARGFDDLNSRLRLVFAGTPEFALPCLEACLAAPADVVAVYTQPDRPAGRGRKLAASPVKQRALDGEHSGRAAAKRCSDRRRAAAPRRATRPISWSSSPTA